MESRSFAQRLAIVFRVQILRNLFVGPPEYQQSRSGHEIVSHVYVSGPYNVLRLGPIFDACRMVFNTLLLVPWSGQTAGQRLGFKLW
jgi:hypothetical protein